MTLRRTAVFLMLVALLATLATPMAGCDLLGSRDESAPLPSAGILIGQMAGNEPGLWRFNPETLNRTGVAGGFDILPTGLAFAPSGEHLYTTWHVGSVLEEDPPLRSVLARLDTRSWEVTTQNTLPRSSAGVNYLIYDSTRSRLIGYGRNDGIIEFYDPTTLTRIKTVDLAPDDVASGDTNKLEIEVAAYASKRDVIYFESHSSFEPGSDTVHQVQVFDLKKDQITRRLLLTEDPSLQRSAVSDLALSPNGRYLYATTYLSPGGPGRFFMVDLKAGKPVFRGPAGGYSNLAVGPGGRYVYIDCPAGSGWLLPPTNQILRFDRKAQKMQVLIDGPRELGLPHQVLIADNITMLPGGESFAVHNSIPATTPDANSEVPSLLKVDAVTGEVEASYVLPLNENGSIKAGFWDVQFGRTQD